MKKVPILKHNLMRAIMTLALMMTCAMAWADNDPVSYIDADGTTQTCTDYTVLTGNESSIGTSGQTKWYVVNSNINYSSSFVCYGNVNIILADDKTMTVNGNTININAYDLTIYGQSGQSGSLNVLNPTSNVSGAIYCNKGRFIINGGTVNAHHGEQNAIFCDHGNFIINRGTVNAIGNSTSSIGIYAKYVTINGGNVMTNARYGIKMDYPGGNITINGGNVTAKGTWGIYTNYIDITLGWSNDSDRIYASQYFVSEGHTINIAEGKYFKDDNGNCYFGTVRANDINNKTLQPATQTEYIQYRLGTGNDGSAQHPYTISDANDWDAFCLALYDNDNWNRFSGKIVKLDANISVTRMAGSDYHDFCGTFDGGGHTITLNGNIENGCYTLFRNVSTAKANPDDAEDTPAAIRNLHVTGTITTASKYAAGLISGKWGNVTIENCRSSVIINSSVSGDGIHAGLVAVNNNFSLNIVGCVFDGKLLTTNGTANCGGFVGWNDGTLNISNCIYAPANAASGETWVSNDGSATFARYNTGHAATITNCYYTTDFNNDTLYTGQGKQALSITTADENVTVENAGTATTYDVSGITSYGTGIKYNNVLYAGNGDAVSLTLGNTLPATYNFFGYIVNHGNLSGNDTEGYTLDMPDENVIITADFCADITNLHIVGEIGNHSVTVGWDNGTGDTIEYAMVAGHNIDLTTVTYEGTTTASKNTWNNLNLDSDYTVVLRRQCSTDHYSQALALEIHTNVACPAPYRLAATNSTATTATLNWSGVQDSYNVRYSPCFLAEGFESGTMPDDWTRTDTSWKITSGTGIGLSNWWNGAATGNYNAGCYIENYDGVSDTLITPVMDLGNIASATLYFNFWNTDWGGYINTLNVYYRVDGGEWHLLYTYNQATEGWIPVTINLEGLAANYQIGFECISHWSYGMGIDDVMVISAWMTKNNVNPFTLTGLTPETFYQWQVQGNSTECGDDEVTDWSETGSFTTLAGTDYSKEITAYGANTSDGGWYLIASPVGDVSATDVINLADVDDNVGFDLYRFNQAAELEWENWKSHGNNDDHYHFSLESGRGYLYANAADVTLVFAGTPYSGNGEVALDYAENTQFAGWNLVGNPFMETVYIDRPFYIMNEGGSEIIAATQVDRDYIEPMEGIFVHADEDGDTMTFYTQEPGKGRGPKPELEQLVLNLSCPSTGSGTGSTSAVIDRAIVRFGDPSTGSGASQTLPKFQIRENSTKLYIPQGGKDYAIATSNGIEEMPLNFRANKSGEYTITVNTENVEMSYLHLIDNMTGADIDLLQTSNYSFNAKTTDYESRFRLVFSAEGSNGADAPFAFIDTDGNIIVNGEGTLQVIDMMGRVMVSVGGHTRCVPTTGMTAGVYVLRLINSEDVKVQKMMIE